MQDHSKLKLNSNTVVWRLEWLKHTYQYYIIEISLPFVTRLWISNLVRRTFSLARLLEYLLPIIAFFEFWYDTLQNNFYFALLGSELQRIAAKYRKATDRPSEST